MARAGARHPDAAAEPADLYAALNEYLLLENKFQPRLCLPNESESGEVTTGARDGAAHVLRSLKVWFDLSPDVLINAINLFDRFLTKMKVRPWHVPCITVSCLNIAIEEHAVHTSTPRTITIQELVSISQSACTAGDVERMSRIVADKLRAPAGRVTALHWLRLFRRLLNATVPALPPLASESEMTKLLELVLCDAQCANARTSELALVLLYHLLEPQLEEWSRTAQAPDCAIYLCQFAHHMQQYCRMCETALVQVRGRVRHVVAQYEARQAQPQRQRLVWRLSERTLKVLRPTDRLTSLLPTIEEQHLAADTTPRKNRSGSESSVSEETCDWPRSPVLPVYCDN